MKRNINTRLTESQNKNPSVEVLVYRESLCMADDTHNLPQKLQFPNSFGLVNLIKSVLKHNHFRCIVSNNESYVSVWNFCHKDKILGIITSQRKNIEIEILDEQFSLAKCGFGVHFELNFDKETSEIMTKKSNTAKEQDRIIKSIARKKRKLMKGRAT